jgi:hypothetical protein
MRELLNNRQLNELYADNKDTAKDVQYGTNGQLKAFTLNDTYYFTY